MNNNEKACYQQPIDRKFDSTRFCSGSDFLRLFEYGTICIPYIESSKKV